MDGTADIMKALLGLGPGGIAAGIWFYLWRQRGVERDAERVAWKAELDAARAKIDELQTKMMDALKIQVETEPKRRETLDAISRTLADQAALLKERLK